MAGNPLGTFISVIFVALMFGIGALVLTIFYNVMPSNALTPSVKLVYDWSFGLFDKSFFFLIVTMVIIDILVSYFKPQLWKGIANIFFVLFYAFIFLNVRTPILTAMSAININSILPNTYATINNDWVALLIFFMLIVATALNFQRKEDENKGSGENG
jgi:hypothetical protein